MSPTPPPPSDEELSAYLCGELDDAATARVEASLDDDAVASRLEALEDLLVALRRVDDVPPPAGFEARLHAALASAPGGGDRAAAPHDAAPRTAGVGGPEAAGAPDTARVVAFPRRFMRWPALGSVAALLVGVVVLAAIATRGGEGEDVAVLSDDSAEVGRPESVEEAELEAGADMATREGGEEMHAGQAAAPGAAQPREGQAGAGAAAGPVVVDSGVRLTDEGDVRGHLADVPEARALLGLPTSRAEQTAARYRVAVQQAPLFDSGRAPAECLDVVAGGSEGPAVAARVESVAWDDAPALLYVLVTASSSAAELDRVEVWITGERCQTQLFLTL